MFSIYMNNDKDGDSYITFGSWDTNILKEGETLNMIKTIRSDSWRMNLDDLVFMNEKISVKTKENPNPTILFDPSVPYI